MAVLGSISVVMMTLTVHALTNLRFVTGTGTVQMEMTKPTVVSASF